MLRLPSTKLFAATCLCTLVTGWASIFSDTGRCQCENWHWADYVQQVRDILKLEPTGKYRGDFSEVAAFEFTRLTSLTNSLLNDELSLVSNLEELRVNSRCPAGIATAAVIGFIYELNNFHKPDSELCNLKKYILEAATVAILLPDDEGVYRCLHDPLWLFDLANVQLNLHRYETRAVDFQTPYHWLATPMPAELSGEDICNSWFAVDSCCVQPEWGDIIRNFDDRFRHPSWTQMSLNNAHILDQWATLSFELLLEIHPWVANCKTGFLAVLLTFSLPYADVPANVLPPILELFSAFSVQEVSSSRFPIFGLMSKVFGSEVSRLMPYWCRVCHSENVVASPESAALVEMSSSAGIFYGLRVDSEEDLRGETCRQQTQLTVDALSGQLHSLLSAKVLSVRSPCLWNMLRVFHNVLWMRPGGTAFGATPSTPFLGPLGWLVHLQRQGQTPHEASPGAARAALEARLRSLDFNGWELPGLAIEPLTDDAWLLTQSLTEELDFRRSQNLRSIKPKPKLRVALLETRFDRHGGTSNMMRGWPEVRAPTGGLRNVFYHRYFRQIWNQFVADPSVADGAPASGKYVGHWDVVHFGLLLAWGADFISWPQRPSSLDIDQISVYDLIIVLDPFPPGRPSELPLAPGQVHLWMPWEPFALEGEVSLPANYCPVPIDQFAVAQVPSVVFWHHYPVEDWRKAFPSSGVSGMGTRQVFMFYYDRESPLLHAVAAAGYEAVRGNGSSKADYWRMLQSSTVAVLPLARAIARRSAGQGIADAAMANCIPTFSPRSKLFARLLLPSFLSYRSYEELLAKLILLRDHPEWYGLLSKAVCLNLRFVDAAEVETAAQLLERVKRVARVASPNETRCGTHRGGASEEDQPSTSTIHREQIPHLANAALGDDLGPDFDGFRFHVL
ncbi:unnamed protein product [Polarella glacialis]|uniref:Uncharacterized protein n=1 Tax=Polarella glacialis TaxID=89957 RepID=A0A813KG98_POLGL|nr:unnamed protein product [Polarella glacialis]